MREGSNRIVSTIYEIATTERACVRVMRSCPLYLFHGSNDGTGWLREITKNATSAAFLKNKQDNNSCENMSAQSPKKKPRGTAQKRRHRRRSDVQWLAIRFRSDQRIGCKTVPNAAIAQMNNNIARTAIKKNPAFMSCITGIIPPPSSCSTHLLR